jgi:sugar transferase (PEP-CTERM/EpsH1 system associated)
MKILVISPRPPYPLYGGFELRAFFLGKQLSKRHELTLFCKTYRELDRESMDNLRSVFSSVRMFPIRKLSPEDRSNRSVLKKIRDLVSPPPEYHETSTYSSELDQAISQGLESGQYDIIHVFGLNMMRYFHDLENYAAICDAMDDYSLFCYRTIRRQTTIANKLRFTYEWIATRRFESRYARKFKEVVMVSPVDARVMKSLCPSANVSVIPIGVDTEYFSPSQADFDEPVVIFTGVMDYEPNVTGALFFAEAVLPLIEKKIPDVRFKIVGRDPDPRLMTLADRRSNIEVTGFVEDMRPHFNRSSVYVCPLKSGAGIKNKILEAWSMAKAVVATEMSCDGVEYDEGEDVIVANDESAFADAVIRLLKDSDLRRKMGENARKKVLERYSWESQAERFEEIYERVTTNATTGKSVEHRRV